jgi:hypothetical protein
MLLGFLASWNANADERARFRALILHEFGHILGFAHEYHRAGPSEEPCYENSMPAGAVALGPVDPASIMGWSYCTSAGAVLSLGDIRGARAIYGSRDIVNRGVLLAGRFRNQRELDAMSGDDHRNTLITELNGRTSRIARSYKALDDGALAGAGAILAFLREAKIRNDVELKGMSDDDRRNTLIVEVAGQTGPARQLQGLSNIELAAVGLGKDRSFIRGVLLLGKFRSWRDLAGMSPEDQRNTLIVELAGRTSGSVPYYQSLRDGELAGIGAALVFLRESRLRGDQELRAMSADDIRNTLIVEIGLQTGMGRELQSLSNLALVAIAFGWIA